MKFTYYRQRDAMDCGPTCLMMVAAAHGRVYPLTYLREHSHLSRDGVSAQGIMEAGDRIGFRSMTVKIPFDTGNDTACLLTAPLPAVAHWNQQHFVVIYKANREYIWVADPAAGKFKLSRRDFEKSWMSDGHCGMSGSGKTTLMKILLGFYPPTKGQIRIRNIVMSSMMP